MGRQITVSGAGFGKTTSDPVTTKHQVVWLMTLSDARALNPYVSYVALGDQACERMAAMLLSSVGIRTSFMDRMGALTWAETGLPKILLVVDDGIALGKWSDDIIRLGKFVGVEVRKIDKGQ